VGRRGVVGREGIRVREALRERLRLLFCPKEPEGGGFVGVVVDIDFNCRLEVIVSRQH
jgi:hypothetical protein